MVVHTKADEWWEKPGKCAFRYRELKRFSTDRGVKRIGLEGWMVQKMRQTACYRNDYKYSKKFEVQDLVKKPSHNE